LFKAEARCAQSSPPSAERLPPSIQGRRGDVRYRAEIDGLRAIAVVPVVLFHSEIDWFKGGYVGVDVFFVISGYLITTILAREIATGSFSISGFYERRARRILPALIALLLATLVAGTILMVPDELAQLGRSSIAAALFVSNIYLFLDTGYFTLDAATTPLLHTWSLGLEEQFYLFYPLFLAALYRFRISLLSGIAVAALASFVLSAVLIIDSPSATFYLLPTRLWELMLGGVVALVPLNASRWREAWSVAGVAAIGAAALLYQASTTFPGPSALLPCLGTAAVIWASSGTRVARVLGSAPLRFVGQTSYSFYLWHWPILVFARLLVGGDLNSRQALFCVVLSFLVGAMSWRWIEQPFRRRSARPRLSVLAVAGLSIGAASAASAAVTSGLPGRFPPTSLKFISHPQTASYEGPGCFLFRESKRKAPAKCLEPADAKPKVVAWGDSHALQFASELDRGSKLDFRLLGQASCPPLLGVVPAKRGIVDQLCLRFNDNALAALAADQSVKTVILAGRWVRFTFAIEDDDARSLLVATNGRPGGTPGELFVALGNTVRQLQQAGKTVMIIGPIPEFELSLPNCLVRVQRLRLDPDYCRFKQETLPGSAFVRQFKREVASLPGVILIDPEAALCPGGRCPREIDGEPVSFDRNHLTPAAAREIMGSAVVREQLARAESVGTR